MGARGQINFPLQARLVVALVFLTGILWWGGQVAKGYWLERRLLFHINAKADLQSMYQRLFLCSSLISFDLQLQVGNQSVDSSVLGMGFFATQVIRRLENEAPCERDPPLSHKRPLLLEQKKHLLGKEAQNFAHLASTGDQCWARIRHEGCVSVQLKFVS